MELYENSLSSPSGQSSREITVFSSYINVYVCIILYNIKDLYKQHSLSEKEINKISSYRVGLKLVNRFESNNKVKEKKTNWSLNYVEQLNKTFKFDRAAWETSHRRTQTVQQAKTSIRNQRWEDSLQHPWSHQAYSWKSLKIQEGEFVLDLVSYKKVFFSCSKWH